MRACLLLAAFLALLPIAGARQSSLSSREARELVERYFALDPKTGEGWSERRGILEKLEAAGAPSRSRTRRWKRTFEDLWSEGKELESEDGDWLFWPEEERGRYIVAGETRSPEALFIGMHGGGVGSGDAADAAGTYASACEELGWLGVFPEVLEKTEHGWTDSGTEELVLELVDAALRTFEIDPDRVFFGGHSMGGYGTWVLGAHHADRVAALVPSAGAPSPTMDRGGRVLSIQKGVIPNLRNVPMLIFQSDDDEKVPPGPNRFAARELEEARARWGGYADQEYWEVSGVGHGLPEGGALTLLQKVAAHERNPRPDKVVWQPDLAWKRQFYWLFWDEPEKDALVVAEIDRSKNRIRVEVEGDPTGLSVLLDGALVDLERELSIVLASLSFGEREVYAGIPERSLAAMVLTAATGDPGRYYEIRVPLTVPE